MIPAPQSEGMTAEKSPDPQPPHAAESMTDAEMQQFLWDWGFSGDDTISPAIWRPARDRWSRTSSPLPPDSWCTPEPQSNTEQQLSDVPAPRSDQEENAESRTPSPVQSDCSVSGSQSSTENQLSDVPPPRSDQEENLASRTPSPAQSDCFASGPQTPERSETPPTPVDHGNASCDLSGDGGEIQESSEVDHEQHASAIGATLPKSHSLTGDGTCQATQGPFQKIPVIDLTEESRPAFSSLRNRQRLTYLRASSTWNCNAPLPSIEGTPFPDRILPSTPNKPFEPQLASHSNINPAASGIRSPEHVAFATQHKRGQNGEAIAKNSEPREKDPANQQKQRTNITTNSSAAQLDPSSSQFFSTFMKFRNSLPLSAAMAMMAPINQIQVLSTLAELSSAQGLTTKPGVAETTAHKVPAPMRAMLDNLKRKFDTDKSFLQSVIAYVTEQLIEDGKSKEQPLDQVETLKNDLDGLKTLPAALEQLVKERKQNQAIIANLENILKQVLKERQQYRTIIANLKDMVKQSKAGDSMGQKPVDANTTKDKNPCALSFPTPSASTGNSSMAQPLVVQSTSPAAYVSPYAGNASRKRTASETVAPSSPKKPHPGYAFAPSQETRNAIRHALPPVKAWMNETAPVQSGTEEKEKEVEKEVEVIEVESDADMASLFGDDDAPVETVDDAVIEADLNEAFDWALSQAD